MKPEYISESLANLVVVKNSYTGQVISYGTRVGNKRITAYSIGELSRKVKKKIGSEFAFRERW